jgi:hypothetical protein
MTKPATTPEEDRRKAHTWIVVAYVLMVAATIAVGNPPAGIRDVIYTAVGVLSSLAFLRHLWLEVRAESMQPRRSQPFKVIITALGAPTQRIPNDITNGANVVDIVCDESTTTITMVITRHTMAEALTYTVAAAHSWGLTTIAATTIAPILTTTAGKADL